MRVEPGIDQNAKVFFVVLVLAVAATVAAVSFQAPIPSGTTGLRCDRSFAARLGRGAAGLCLALLQIAVDPYNFSKIIIPVMSLKPGATTSLDILYSVGSESQGHIGPKVTIYANNTLSWMEVPSGNLSSRVVSSEGRLVFKSSYVVIYEYTITAAAGTAGYFALLPPYYAGILPALAVGEDPRSFNFTTLSTWSYTGQIMTAENNIPSTVVGTGNMGIFNVTLPDSPECQNPACNLVAHSLF